MPSVEATPFLSEWISVDWGVNQNGLVSNEVLIMLNEVLIRGISVERSVNQGGLVLNEVLIRVD